MKSRVDRDPPDDPSCSPTDADAGPLLLVACAFTMLWNGRLGRWPGHPGWPEGIASVLTTGSVLGALYALIRLGASAGTPRLRPSGESRVGGFTPEERGSPLRDRELDG
jgi:hypothetical protein